MNVLVVGSGGREHALAWKIAQSPRVEGLFCAPGNPGMAQLAECADIDVMDFDRLVAFAWEKHIDLAVIGPEDPLAAGLADRFAAAGIRAFGPSAKAARLEASKAFAKAFMARHAIPTARHWEFEDAQSAIAHVKEHGAPIVVKADGLATGKGVTVALDVDAAIRAIEDVMVVRSFGDAGDRIVLEERLLGEEASIFALTDGKTLRPLIPVQDHKTAFDGDQGPNTGGMGAYAPAPVVTNAMMAEIERAVLRPCIEGMAAEGAPYKGLLYAGLMITPEGPKVVEFNCRFGDPETQVVLPLMDSDIVPILLACVDGTLSETHVEWKPGACVTVVMASGGYPRNYEKGKIIKGLEDIREIDETWVFHAGTREERGFYYTNGGRVLNITALGADLREAVDRAYRAVNLITFDNAHYRRDIAKKALGR